MSPENIRKIPTRKCTGCGEHFPKSTLVRILRTPDGEIMLDLRGKLSGRGAYVCKSLSCIKKARRQGRVEKSLECSIPDVIWDRIETELIENG